MGKMAASYLRKWEGAAPALKVSMKKALEGVASFLSSPVTLASLKTLDGRSCA